VVTLLVGLLLRLAVIDFFLLFSCLVDSGLDLFGGAVEF
jgi:hypothetical protein